MSPTRWEASLLVPPGQRAVRQVLGLAGMRFLPNENVPLVVVEALRRRGHDVSWLRVEAARNPDEAVLAGAVSQERVLLTFDRDFGSLVFSPWSSPDSTPPEPVGHQQPFGCTRSSGIWILRAIPEAICLPGAR